METESDSVCGICEESVPDYSLFGRRLGLAGRHTDYITRGFICRKCLNWLDEGGRLAAAPLGEKGAAALKEG